MVLTIFAISKLSVFQTRARSKQEQVSRRISNVNIVSGLIVVVLYVSATVHAALVWWFYIMIFTDFGFDMTITPSTPGGPTRELQELLLAPPNWLDSVMGTTVILNVLIADSSLVRNSVSHLSIQY